MDRTGKKNHQLQNINVHFIEDWKASQQLSYCGMATSCGPWHRTQLLSLVTWVVESHSLAVLAQCTSILHQTGTHFAALGCRNGGWALVPPT
mmetsp:Transcript_8027/g.13857  ORF Transcript_8027/g.13857 Transcript_8027/m.13857 type:complete len:92 (+) Transcript_8027:53-328(+)